MKLKKTYNLVKIILASILFSGIAALLGVAGSQRAVDARELPYFLRWVKLGSLSGATATTDFVSIVVHDAKSVFWSASRIQFSKIFLGISPLSQAQQTLSEKYVLDNQQKKLLANSFVDAKSLPLIMPDSGFSVYLTWTGFPFRSFLSIEQYTNGFDAKTRGIDVKIDRSEFVFSLPQRINLQHKLGIPVVAMPNTRGSAFITPTHVLIWGCLGNVFFWSIVPWCILHPFALIMSIRRPLWVLRQRCPTCGYHGVPTAIICPECGNVAQSHPWVDGYRNRVARRKST